MHDAIEKLPVDIRRCIALYMSVPYLGQCELMITRDMVLRPNRWCTICGETASHRAVTASRVQDETRDASPEQRLAQLQERHEEAMRRIMLRRIMLCWACGKTVCRDCWHRSRCCTDGNAATVVS